MNEIQAGNSHEPRRGRDRRDFLRKAAIAGGAAWTAPTLVSAIVAPAAAQTTVPVPIEEPIPTDGPFQSISAGRSGLYGSAHSGTYRVDATTGAWTMIGPKGVAGSLDMGCDSSTGILYGGLADPRFCTVDLESGAWTPTFSTSLRYAISVAGAPGALYVIGLDGGLWRIDLSSQSASFIGITRPEFNYLAYDPIRNRIYITTYDLPAAAMTLWSVNPSDAVLTEVGSGAGFFNGPMTFDSSTDTLYCIDDRALCAINPTTGAWSVVGTTSVTDTLGLAYVP